MDLQKLKIFRTLYEERSYTKAARQLGLSQSAVSQHIKVFEEILGVKLFDAQKRTFPTAAADYLYQEGVKLLALARDLENSVKQIEGVGKGDVRFGMIDVAAIEFAPEILASFRKKHPHVEVTAFVKPSGEIIDDVSQNKLDFGLVVCHDLPENVKAHILYHDSIVAVVPLKSSLAKQKEISVRDLKAEPLILYPASSLSRDLIEAAFQKKRLRPQVAMEMHYPEAMLSLVDKGVGIALMSALSAKRSALKGHKILSIRELKNSRNIGLITKHQRHLSPQALAFISAFSRKS